MTKIITYTERNHIKLENAPASLSQKFGFNFKQLTSIKIMKAKNNLTESLKSKCRTSSKAIIRLTLIIFCLFSSIVVTNAQDGEAVFRKNCGVCHTVGGGRLVGPDLIGITAKRSEEWLLKWTKSSQSLVKSGDADAKAILDEYNGMIMPDQALSDAEIKAILAFVNSKSSPSVSAVEDTTKKVAVVDASNNATPEQIELGKNIFIGNHSLSNGGASCISCHNVNYTGVIPGGLLAKDLTTVYSRLGGDAGLHGILGAPPFPAMTEAYKDKPLNEEEIAALIAFFNKVDNDKPNQIVSSMNPLLYGGFAGFVTILILIFIIWNKRKSETVKKDILNRQLKTK